MGIFISLWYYRFRFLTSNPNLDISSHSTPSEIHVWWHRGETSAASLVKVPLAKT